MADGIREMVVAAIEEVAPEVDAAAIDGALPLQEQLDLDSIDMLGVLTRIEEETGVGIPERDYARVATLDAMVAYLGERAAAR